MASVFERIFRIKTPEFQPLSLEDLLGKIADGHSVTKANIFLAKNFRLRSKPKPRKVKYLDEKLSLSDAYTLANTCGIVAKEISDAHPCDKDFIESVARYPSYVEDWNTVKDIICSYHPWRYILPLCIQSPSVYLYDVLKRFVIKGYFEDIDPLARLEILYELPLPECLVKFGNVSLFTCSDDKFNLLCDYLRTGDLEFFCNQLDLVDELRNETFAISWLLRKTKPEYTPREIVTYFNVRGINTIEEFYSRLETSSRESVCFRWLAMKPINSRTTLLEEIEDLDPEEMVYYGTLGMSIVYSSDELYHAVEVLGDGSARYRKPDNPRQLFSEEEVYQLGRMFPKGHKLRQIIKDCPPMNEDLRTSVEALSGLPRELVVDFFEKIFNCAMYMRRWKGPGHPYPKKKTDTTGEIDEVKISELLLSLKEVLDNDQAFKEKINEIPSLDIGAETPDEEYSTFGELLEAIMANDYCIRVGSTIFLNVSSAVLNMFTEGDYSIRDFESIS